jgi:hypothetical protein
VASMAAGLQLPPVAAEVSTAVPAAAIRAPVIAMGKVTVTSEAVALSAPPRVVRWLAGAAQPVPSQQLVL